MKDEMFAERGEVGRLSCFGEQAVLTLILGPSLESSPQERKNVHRFQLNVKTL